MFTGLVEEIGTVAEVEDYGDGVRLRINAKTVLSDAALGDSISVNGVCLTVTSFEEGIFSADVMQESLDRSSLGALKTTDPVNLERAVAVGQRLGGHIMQGHVDGTAKLLSRESSEHWDVLRFELPDNLVRFVVEKGSIALNGVSLTISALGEGYFEVSLIPTTLEHTTMGTLKVGDLINIEVDVLGKYVDRMMSMSHTEIPNALR
ncbi:riboflavin synthase [Corynebacterium caspium]|uniref:riboflavin synthase n=1 Tax=Corynebacterium caspium TaxID=234828 RepID=UPI00036DFA28|nr:riboflavin synthase [Corynebacterium caspium]WKD59228.1 Riboflavin synthase [Corynebacterium caspium DSM 44850]